jgi:hypothetical protein
MWVEALPARNRKPRSAARARTRCPGPPSAPRSTHIARSPVRSRDRCRPILPPQSHTCRRKLLARPPAMLRIRANVRAPMRVCLATYKKARRCQQQRPRAHRGGDARVLIDSGQPIRDSPAHASNGACPPHPAPAADHNCSPPQGTPVMYRGPGGPVYCCSWSKMASRAGLVAAESCAPTCALTSITIITP